MRVESHVLYTKSVLRRLTVCDGATQLAYFDTHCSGRLSNCRLAMAGHFILSELMKTVSMLGIFDDAYVHMSDMTSTNYD
jgi:hypothetical protein